MVKSIDKPESLKRFREIYRGKVEKLQVGSSHRNKYERWIARTYEPGMTLDKIWEVVLHDREGDKRREEKRKGNDEKILFAVPEHLKLKNMNRIPEWYEGEKHEPKR